SAATIASAATPKPASARPNGLITIPARDWRSALIPVRDRQLFRGVERDDLGPVGRAHDLFLDAGRRKTVARGAVGFEREDHAGLDLHGVVEGVEAGDDRALVEPKPEAMAEEEAEGFHFAGEADLLGLGPGGGDAVGGDAGAHQRDRGVDPFARLLVGVLLCV